MKMGKEYEGIWKDTLKSLGVFKDSTEAQDRLAGTDGFWNRIPVDFTFAFNVKSNMAVKANVPNTDMYIGIRTGNGVVDFDTPVAVVGHDAEPFFVKDWILPNLESNIRKYAAMLADEIADVYWDYCDEHGLDM